MKLYGVWVLAIILGLAGTSCAVRKSDIIYSFQERQVATSTTKGPDTATQAKVEAAYGNLPLHFEANQGQSDEQVKFLSRGSGYTLFLTPTEAVLTLHKSEPKAKGKKQRAKGKREEQEKTDLAKLETRNSKLETVVRMKLVGANPNPRIQALEKLPGKVNYFIGNDPQKWHTNIPTYAKIKYQDVYPGVDLIYYGNQRQLEYDFVVAPGADPEVIRLAFDGLVGAGMPPHPIPLVAQPSWLRAGWKPAPLGERGPMPSVFAPSPLAADKSRYHEPKDGKAGLHPLSDSPPSKGERKEGPSPSKGEGEDGGESRLPPTN